MSKLQNIEIKPFLNIEEMHQWNQYRLQLRYRFDVSERLVRRQLPVTIQRHCEQQGLRLQSYGYANR